MPSPASQPAAPTPLPADAADARSSPPDPPPAGGERRFPAILRMLGLLTVGFVFGRLSVGSPPPPALPPTPLSGSAVPIPSDPEAKTLITEPVVGAGEELTGDRLLHSQLIGQWTAQSHGTQVCTLNPDGSGSNVAELDWMAALIYGKHLRMDIRWSVREGHLVQDLLGGEPADMIEKLAADFGRVKTYRVEEMTADRAVLVDTSDEEAVVWTRVR